MDSTGQYILVGGNQRFYFRRPFDFDYKIEHIAAALSKICRFSGHTKEFYSVAQHSVMCARLVPTEYALEALLHDASEAFLGDVTSPLKSLLREYKQIEAATQQAIFNAFGVVTDTPAVGGLSEPVHRADMIALATEKRDLMGDDDGPGWACLAGIEPDPRDIRHSALDPVSAENLFLQVYEQLTN